jgi:hypothetical protein
MLEWGGPSQCMPEWRSLGQCMPEWGRASARYCYSPWSILLYHFSVRSAFVQRSYSVRSPFVQRSITVHKAFVHRSFSIRSPFTKRSPFVHRSFIVHKAFTVYNSNYHSELQWERTYFCREKMKYKSAGLLFPQVQHNENCRGSPVCYIQTKHAEFLKSLWKNRFYCWWEKRWNGIYVVYL